MLSGNNIALRSEGYTIFGIIMKNAKLWLVCNIMQKLPNYVTNCIILQTPLTYIVTLLEEEGSNGLQRPE